MEFSGGIDKGSKGTVVHRGAENTVQVQPAEFLVLMAAPGTGSGTVVAEGVVARVLHPLMA